MALVIKQAALCMGAAFLMLGCASPGPSDHPQFTDADRAAFRDTNTGRPSAPPHPKTMDLLSGPAPLAYLTEQHGDVWVTDDQSHQWGPVAVSERAIVRVSVEGGVKIGTILLEHGPLADGRVYTIHMNAPADETGWRNGWEQTAPPTTKKAP